MTEWIFRLNVTGVVIDDDGQMDRLYEAGCDDGTFATDEAGVYVVFTREALTAEMAVLSAIRDIETTDDKARVLRVEIEEEWLTAAEIASRLGRSRQSISQLVRGERGPGGFPVPISRRNARNPLWDWEDVRTWFALYEPGSVPENPEQASHDFLAAVNDRLDFRERVRRSPEAPWWNDLAEVLPFVS